MADKPKILCFAGSLRRDSLNKKLAKQACALAEKAGAEATFIDLKDYPMPIYDGDIEAESGLPENAKKLKALMKSHDAFLIACPEYNSSITAALKNAIDWASRPEPDEKPLACYVGKVAGLMAASPGALGGLRGLVVVRSLLSNINVLVVPEQHAISRAAEAFDGEGKLVDAKNQQAVEKIVNRVVGLVRGQQALSQ
ncbi:MAG: NAD(P)H-dependent oxidoreductase [Cyanobacteria bacterium SZAS LIN-3]|nr:NAD(P)H-dependent oxidoreductase [Cyanobacteria bacterium SZAS LIN-3]MBS2007419.1 NAD(P)H-dependent oxidoreductase [Cyanobacteria bacterium SZAS TMP-1]